MSNVVPLPTSGAPPLPDYTEHQDRTIVWGPWVVAARAICRGPAPCEQCRSTDEPLFSAGRQQPHPGETFTASVPRRSGHIEGAAYKQGKVPAWPVNRLCAYRCTSCGHLDVLDMADDYRPVDITRPSLF